MGLIKAAAGAAGGVLADQWKEFFTCEALPANVLAVKGQKKTTRRSSNTHGDENIITTGSRIAVADGQCMLIVEQGKVVEVCAEPSVISLAESGPEHDVALAMREALATTGYWQGEVWNRRRSGEGYPGWLGVSRPGGLDQQRHFGGGLDGGVPAIHRSALRQDVHAGGQALLDQQPGDALRTGHVGQVGEDEEGVGHGEGARRKPEREGTPEPLDVRLDSSHVLGEGRLAKFCQAV